MSRAQQLVETLLEGNIFYKLGRQAQRKGLMPWKLGSEPEFIRGWKSSVADGKAGLLRDA